MIHKDAAANLLNAILAAYHALPIGWEVEMDREMGLLMSEVREAAGLTQKQLAARLRVNQSRISRMEGGDASFERHEYEAALGAIGTEAAESLRAVITLDWRNLARPSFRHPDLPMLIEIEGALEELREFMESESIPHVLAGQAELLFRRLHDSGAFLLRLDHRVSYMGEIGVGKTTAVCKQSGLVIDPMNPHDLRGMMLDTGGGRTTLCDVVVQSGATYALEVDPLTDEEVYRLAGEFCRSVYEKAGDGTQTVTPADFRPPEEVVRALRNMAGLPRPPRPRSGPVPSDPIEPLLESASSVQDFQAEFSSRLGLWRRTRRSIEFEGMDDTSGRTWVRETFTAINNGRHPEFSLPAKITVTVPFSPVAGTPFNIVVVDTRGIDGSPIRPDIVAQLSDQRAVVILCSKWGSAPEPSTQELLKYAIETEVDPGLLSRVAILTLARSGDALSMRHDSGDNAEDIEEGYEIKCRHVEDALDRANIPGVEVTVLDSAQDNALDLTKFIIQKIVGLRTSQAASARSTIAAVRQMLENVEQAQALAALGKVGDELGVFARRHDALKRGRSPVQQRLLQAIRTRHPRSVWAATRRKGTFWNFNFYQYLGDGAAMDARRRGVPALNGLREILENKLADPAFAAAHTFLQQILENVSAWESDFVKSARHYAIAVYKAELEAAETVWVECDEMYGQQKAYREEVAAKIDVWFDEQEELAEELERHTQREWRKTVLEPLLRASGQ